MLIKPLKLLLALIIIPSQFILSKPDDIPDNTQSEHTDNRIVLGMNIILPLQRFMLVEFEASGTSFPRGMGNYPQVGFSVFGFSVSLGYYFLKNLNFEVRHNISFISYPITEEQFINSFSAIIKISNASKDCYGLLSYEIINFDVGPYKVHQVIPIPNNNNTWKNFIGLGFGVRIWQKFYFEHIVEFPVGNNFLNGIIEEFNDMNTKTIITETIKAGPLYSSSLGFILEL